MGRILLVDDDDDIRDSLAMALEETYAVVQAADGVQALRLLESERFDAVVLDLMMPLMDGASLLRHMHTSGMRVPVIIASAGGDLPGKTRELGAVDFVRKPFDIARLEEKLASAIKRTDE